MNFGYEKEELKKFDDVFSALNDKRIAIYGLGEGTDYIVKKYPKHNIVGLLDQYLFGGIVYGKRLLRFKDLKQERIQVIVITAVPEEVEVRRKHIAAIAYENNIHILSLRGEILDTFDGNNFPPHSPIHAVTAQRLFSLCDHAEIIFVGLLDVIYTVTEFNLHTVIRPRAGIHDIFLQMLKKRLHLYFVDDLPDTYWRQEVIDRFLADFSYPISFISCEQCKKKSPVEKCASCL